MGRSVVCISNYMYENDNAFITISPSSSPVPMPWYIPFPVPYHSQTRKSITLFNHLRKKYLLNDEQYTG